MRVAQVFRRLLRRLTASARQAIAALDDPGAQRDCAGHACAGYETGEKSGLPDTSS